MLALSTKSCSVTIDSVGQKIYFVPHRRLFSEEHATWWVSFEEIVQVYLNFWEDSFTVEYRDEYSTHYEPRIWRRWAIELTLSDGRVVAIGEETTDQRANETKTLDRQHAYWESLAASVSELLGKPLAAMPAVPDSPRTFVQAIDQILQRRLRQSGLHNLSVNIRSGKDEGIEIIVNGKSYAAVDEVEDKAVREVIQASIDEWEGSSN
jgi:hypothetical protein